MPVCRRSCFAKNRAQKVFAGLFQKAADSKGRAFGRVPTDAKSFAFIRIRKGDATARWAVASWETLSRGFPMRRLTPHLCNLLSANQFFDTLKRPSRFTAGRAFLPEQRYSAAGASPSAFFLPFLASSSSAGRSAASAAGSVPGIDRRGRQGRTVTIILQIQNAHIPRAAPSIDAGQPENDC